MIPLVHLWLPILLSAVLVFIASSILHMVLKFWHTPDCSGFSNEDELRATMRKGISGPGLYLLPYCTPEAMKQPEMQEKFRQGPNAFVFVLPNGMRNMGATLTQWFLFCVLVSLFCALLVMHMLAPSASFARVFHVTALAALMGYALGAIPNAIWWGHRWRSALKHIIDGVIYAIITGLTFAYLWPA